MEILTAELVTMVITQLPNFVGFLILSWLLVWQTQKAWNMANLIIERCVPDGDCIKENNNLHETDNSGIVAS